MKHSSHSAQDCRLIPFIGIKLIADEVADALDDAGNGFLGEHQFGGHRALATMERAAQPAVRGTFDPVKASHDNIIDRHGSGHTTNSTGLIDELHGPV